MREERIGEWLETASAGSPVPWERVVEHWLPLHAASRAPALTERNLDHLHKLVDGGTWAVTNDTASFLVLHVGLWDGWPYWRPRVGVCILGPLQSPETLAFGDVRDIFPAVHDPSVYLQFRRVSPGGAP